MGQFFSRPGKFAVDGKVPGTVGSAGDVSTSSLDSIRQFLGHNTGHYYNNGSSVPPIPFEWIISPDLEHLEATGLQCPHSSATLLTFGVADVVTVVLTVLLASRPVVRALTLGRFGNRDKSSIFWTWVIHFAFQLLGNAIAAAVIGRTEGYRSLNMLHIFTVFAGRPRTDLIVLAALRATVPVRPRKGKSTRAAASTRRGPRHKLEFIYADAYITAAISALCMSLIAALFIGVTWGRYPSTSDTKKFMVSLVQFSEAGPGLITLVILVLCPVYQRFGEVFHIRGRGGSWSTTLFSAALSRDAPVMESSFKSAWLHRAGSAFATVVILGVVSIVQWNYFASLLMLPGALWCPPKLLELGIVWVIFATLGNVVGGAA